MGENGWHPTQSDRMKRLKRSKITLLCPVRLFHSILWKLWSNVLFYCCHFKSIDHMVWIYHESQQGWDVSQYQCWTNESTFKPFHLDLFTTLCAGAVWILCLSVLSSSYPWLYWVQISFQPTGTSGTSETFLCSATLHSLFVKGFLSTKPPPSLIYCIILYSVGLSEKWFKT